MKHELRLKYEERTLEADRDFILCPKIVIGQDGMWHDE